MNKLELQNKTRQNLAKRWFLIVSLILLGVPQDCLAQLRLPAIDPMGRGIFLPQQSAEILRPGNAMRNNLGLYPSAQPRVGQPLMQPQPYVGLGPTYQPQGFAQPQPVVRTNPVTPSPRVGASQWQGQASPSQRSSNQPAFQQPPTPPACDGSDRTRKNPKKCLIPDPAARKTPGERGQIIMTPSRIVAPVGSEVVVLAGICGGDGFFVKNQPLQWMLSNNSVGEIVEVGGMHHPSFNKLIPPTSKKFSGQYAVGRTGLKRIVLSRGTPTPVDDIELAKGQTFVSVSSASSGTTYITAVAPKAEGWDKRRASTIIHWVDGQWSVPVPAQATAGTVYPLTTVVSSADNGRGLKGWEVRYAIVGGAPAEFAPSGSKTAVAKTKSDGKATVQIRQPAGQFSPGTSQIRVDIVRPAVFGEPELVVESGLTAITWSAPALTIRAIGPRKAEFNEPFNYRVEVTNPGDQIARDVVVSTKNLDDGIEYISSDPKPTQYGRNFEWQFGDIAPGSAPKVLNVSMKSKKRGNVGMCFEVASATDRLQTEACAETEIILPCIGLNIDGPTRAQVGDTVTFNLNLENQCDEPLESMRVKITYDNGLVWPGQSNPVLVTLAPKILQFGETSSLPVTLNIQAPGTRCFDVEVTAKGVQPKIERRCFEAVADLGGGGMGANGQGSQSSVLQMRLSGGRPTEIKSTTLVEAKITNTGNVPLERVTLINKFSPSLRPRQVTKEFLDGFKIIDDELFLQLGTIAPKTTKLIEIEYDGLSIDPNALTAFTVTTPAIEQGSSQSLRIRVGAVGSLDGNAAGSIDQPDFGTEQPNGGMGIPADNGPTAGDLEVNVQTLDPNIRVGESGKIQFSVQNKNQTQTLKNVNVRLLVPNSIVFKNLYCKKNVKLVSQYEFSTIRELRANETIDWVAVVEGVTEGQALFGIDAKSDDTFGLSSDRDAIYVSQ